MGQGVAQAIGARFEGVEMVPFFGVNQDVEAASRIKMVGDVAGHCEAIKLGIKGEAGCEGWFAPCVPSDRAGRDARVEAQPGAGNLLEAIPEAFVLGQCHNLWCRAQGAGRAFGRAFSQMCDG